MSKPKEHVIYSSAADGLSDILGAAIQDEPKPTPAAAQLIEEANRAGPLVPDAQAVPAVAGGGGGNGELVDAVPSGPSPRESAENAIELLFALVPAGDWQPESQAEREELIAALERVFVVRGWSLNLPPEMILIAVAGKFTRRRMQKPHVAAKMRPWLSKMPLIGKMLGAPDDPAPVDREKPAAAWPAGSLPGMSSAD